MLCYAAEGSNYKFKIDYYLVKEKENYSLECMYLDTIPTNTLIMILNCLLIEIQSWKWS